MLRFLVLFALVLVVLYLAGRGLDRLAAAARGDTSRGGGGRVGDASPRGTGGGRGASDDRLVSCAQCGVHVPARRALTARVGATGGTVTVCSEACRERLRTHAAG